MFNSHIQNNLEIRKYEHASKIVGGRWDGRKYQSNDLHYAPSFPGDKSFKRRRVNINEKVACVNRIFSLTMRVRPPS